MVGMPLRNCNREEQGASKCGNLRLFTLENSEPVSGAMVGLGALDRALDAAVRRP